MEFVLRNGINKKEFYNFINWQGHNLTRRTCYFCKSVQPIKKITVCQNCWNKIVKQSYYIYPFSKEHNLFSKSIFKNIFKRTYD